MKQAINTRTQEEYDALMKTATMFGKTPLTDNRWPKYGPLTCINTEFPSLRFSDVEYYEHEGYTIIPYTEFAKTIKPESKYKEMYPDKTDAQIIELLDWELGEKVQTIGRLLTEKLALKTQFNEAKAVLEKIIEYSNAGKTLPKIDSQVAAIARQALKRWEDGE